MEAPEVSQVPVGPAVDCTLCFFFFEKFIHSNTSPYATFSPQICNHFSVWQLYHLKMLTRKPKLFLLSLSSFDFIESDKFPDTSDHQLLVSQSVTVHVFTLTKKEGLTFKCIGKFIVYLQFFF